MEVFYEKAGFAKCWYDPAKNMIVQDYEHFVTNVADYQEQLDEAYKVLVKHKVTKWLTDTSKPTLAVPLEAQEWVGKVHTPRCIQAGLKYLATVLPVTAIGKMTTKSWQGTVQQFGTLQLANFATFDEAMAWLDKQP